MRYFENFVYELAMELPNWGSSQTVYALAAILVVYIFIVFSRSSGNSG